MLPSNSTSPTAPLQRNASQHLTRANSFPAVSTPQIPLFLLGVGFIGGSLLRSLLASNKYAITALVRSEDKAKVLKSLGVTPLFGSLSDEELISNAVLKNDVIIHTATADDLASVRAILAGLAKRPASAPAAVYIHTSGTGLLADDGAGLVADPHVFSDKKPEEVDALPDTAYHRDVDLLIKNAVDGGKVGSAKVAILFPPLIYGIGTGPFNQISIQIPGWIRDSIVNKQVSCTGKGASIWNNIHVANLVLAYETLLTSLLSAPLPSLYVFAETGEHTWLSVAEAIQAALSSRGLVEGPLVFSETKSYLGSNSRSKAERLRELGWSPEERPSVWESLVDELEVILREDRTEWARLGEKY